MAEQAEIQINDAKLADLMGEEYYDEEEYPRDYDHKYEDYIAGGELAGDIAREGG